MRFTASRLASLGSSLIAVSAKPRGFQARNEFDRGRSLSSGRRTAVVWTAAILLALVSVGMRSGAQDLSTGSLNVTVTDSAGALIPGAKLVLKDLETNDVHDATTKNDGAIVIPFLNPAIYSLTVSKEGFASKPVREGDDYDEPGDEPRGGAEGRGRDRDGHGDFRPQSDFGHDVEHLVHEHRHEAG